MAPRKEIIWAQVNISSKEELEAWFALRGEGLHLQLLRIRFEWAL
jgi:hypothetical protein